MLSRILYNQHTNKENRKLMRQTYEHISKLSRKRISQTIWLIYILCKLLVTKWGHICTGKMGKNYYSTAVIFLSLSILYESLYNSFWRDTKHNYSIYLVLNTFCNILLLGQQNNLLYNIFIIVQKIKKVKTYFIITYFIKSKAISIKSIKMCSKWVNTVKKLKYLFSSWRRFFLFKKWNTSFQSKFH